MNPVIEVLKKRPLVSIIMPCYNSEAYVEKAIQSCLKQTFDNWELIIINDGSTDNTLNIVNSYAVRDNRLHVYSKENGGYVSAVNYGLDYVNGFYFMFMGSDDEITPSLFQEIFEHLNFEKLPDMIGFRTSVVKADKTVVEDKDSRFFEIAKDDDCDIKQFSTAHPNESNIFFTRDTSKLFKTDLLGSLRYFGKKGMDADGIFSMLFTHKASSFLCVPVIGYIWYLREESLSGRKTDYQTQIDRLSNWCEFRNEIVKIDVSMITNQEKHYLTSYYFSILKSVVFEYYGECLKNRIIENSKIFLSDNVELFGEKWASEEMQLFLCHAFWWQHTIRPKIYLDKTLKCVKRYIRKLLK